ncbi:MAG TPA: hypothetical protein VJ802_04680 [Gemmatimonadaceae bacterium]|nr:hypothetical protein [Gemmatimonadaceae bacterium]
MLTPWMAARRSVLAWCILVAFGACDRSRDPGRRTDTTLPPSVGAVESLPRGEQAQRWESGTGAVLLVRDDTVTRAIYPTLTQLDSTAVLDEDVVRGFIAEAVSTEGAAGSLRIRGFSAIEEECAVWPAVALAADSSRSWTVAFQRGVASPITLRPIESLTAVDSARLAVDLTRLAALLPNDTSRVFRGLPFVIRTAHGFTPPGGMPSVVAEIVRRVNVEANPREETLLLIAEREGPGAGWRTVYSERASGDELHVERATPLAAVMLGAQSLPTVVIERTGADWVTYAFIQRFRDGVWRESWESAHSGC